MVRSPEPVDPINMNVGGRLRLKRVLKGMSQSTLGQTIGVSRIKIGQFESGQSGIPAATLYKLAHHLDIEVSFFFSDLNDGCEENDQKSLEEMLSPEAISLLRDFDTLENPIVKKKLAAVLERITELTLNRPE